MAASEPSEALDYVVRRLVRWGQLAPSGLVLASSPVEDWCIQAEAQLGQELAALGLPFRSVMLPEAIPADSLVYWLQDNLGDFPDTLLSLRGWERACPPDVRRADWLHTLNFNRENLLAVAKRQVWWVTPFFREQLTTTTPDLARFFLVRVNIASGPPPTPPAPTAAVARAPLPRTVWEPLLPEAFFPRRGFLEELKASLLPKGLVALTGIGGVGKTTLAAAFVKEHRAAFPTGVFWLMADTPEGIEASLNEYAAQVKPALVVAGEPALTATRFLNHLAAQGKFLLIADNVEEQTIAERFAPLSQAGSVLFTSRRRLRLPKLHALSVECLAPEEGAQLLLLRAGLTQPSEEDRELALTLAQHLGGLPLALEQMGAFVQTRQNTTLRQCLADFERASALRPDSQAAVASPSLGELPYLNTILTMYHLALERLQSEGAVAAIHLTRLLAFLAPDGMQEHLLRDAYEAMEEPLRTAAGSEGGWQAALESLTKLALVQRTPVAINNHEPIYVLSEHRLVRAVIITLLAEEQRRRYAEEAVCIVNAVTPDILETRWWEESPLWPQWTQLAETIQIYNLRTPEAARILNTTGVWLHYSARYTEAEPLYRKALEIDLDIHGEQHPSTARDYNNLAELLRATGRYVEAEPLYRKALEIDLDIHGEQHPNTAIHYNNLALLLEATGRYAEAEPLYRKALEIDLDIHGEQHPDTATDYNNLAGLLEATGRYAEAEPLFRKALEIDLAIHGEQHPSTARDYNNLAGLLRATGRYAEAERLGRKAFRTILAILGPDHPNVRTTAANWLGMLNLAKARGGLKAKDIPTALVRQAESIVNKKG